MQKYYFNLPLPRTYMGSTGFTKQVFVGFPYRQDGLRLRRLSPRLVEAAFTPVRETQIGQTDVSFAVPLAKYGDRLLLVFALETGLPCPPHVGLSTRWRFEARRDRSEKTHCS